MKSLFVTVFIAVILFVLNTGKVAGVEPFFATSCSYTHGYKIGIVDPRFKLSREKFKEYAKQAADIWSGQKDEKLFVYRDDGDLTVNLVFDERQELNDQISTLEKELNSGKSGLEQKIANYEKQAAEFRQKLDNLNTKIEYWNSRGGAPESEYEKLKAEQKTLQEEGNGLNELAKELNLGTNAYNSQVKTLNQTVSNFNQRLQLKPEEGIYIPKTNTIDVYFNISKDELVHTLTHEFGHALGIDHNQDEKSIMYPFTTESVTLSTEDVGSLEETCQKMAVNNFYARRLDSYLSQVRASFK